MIDTSDYYSAGFTITRRVDRPDWCSARLLPEKLLSLSDHICPIAPETWCIEWTGDTRETRLEKAAAFGLDADGLERLTAWVTARFGESIGWPNICLDPGTARELASLLPAPDLAHCELAVHRRHWKRFMRAAAPPPHQPGGAPVGPPGIYEALQRKAAVTTGKVLGHEPLVFDRSLSDSWLCNGLDREVESELGIRPNRHGFIESFEDACRCVEYISRDDVGAEPGLWLPWLVVELDGPDR